MNRSILTAISISLLTLGLTGCVSGLQGSTYSRSEARQIQEVEFGTVLSTNPVVIEGKQSGAGQLPGAIIGGVAGSSVGEGKGQQIFTILGAVGGAVVGSMIEEQATRTQGLELTIKMDSGKTLSIVQEVDNVNVFREGQRVRVLTQGALARVSPE
jgi:outer membrane lipoprotein SlyB